MKDKVNIFIQAENEMNLFELKLCGFQIWPWIRIEIFRNLNKELFGQNIVPAYERQKFDVSNGNIYDGKKYLNILKKKYSNTQILISSNAKRAIIDADSLTCPTTGIIKNIFGASAEYMMHSYMESSCKIENCDSILVYCIIEN